MKFRQFAFWTIFAQATFAHGGLTPAMFLPVGLILLAVVGVPALITYKVSKELRWLKASGAGMVSLTLLCLFLYHI